MAAGQDERVIRVTKEVEEETVGESTVTSFAFYSRPDALTKMSDNHESSLRRLLIAEFKSILENSDSLTSE